MSPSSDSTKKGTRFRSTQLLLLPFPLNLRRSLLSRRKKLSKRPAPAEEVLPIAARPRDLAPPDGTIEEEGKKVMRMQIEWNDQRDEQESAWKRVLFSLFSPAHAADCLLSSIFALLPPPQLSPLSSLSSFLAICCSLALVLLKMFYPCLPPPFRS